MSSAKIRKTISVSEETYKKYLRIKGLLTYINGRKVTDDEVVGTLITAYWEKLLKENPSLASLFVSQGT